VQRVSVVGNTGSGKSTLARKIAAAIGASCIELDAIHHMPKWTPIDADVFLAEAERLASGESWVVDGNYRTVVVDGPFWERADTVVWLALPRHQVMRQVTARTMRRALTRQVLWNGNREPLKNFLPFWRESIIRWAWTQHEKYERRYGAAMTDPAYAHINFVKLTSYRDADDWLSGLVS